ncbi:hypothetical protein ABGN05_23095 [Aquibium sp. LZ166]|uniref:Uncharacterized protein n=1 Tax=Aquibium pacificus TaxID=3153579 RepID=A0ABV3SP37_9HYPH
MPLTNAERQKRHYERRKEMQKRAPDLVRAFAARPFYEFYGESGDAMSFETALDIAGIEPPSFDDDSGPASFSGEIERGDPGNETYHGQAKSIGRAEVMVGTLMSAAAELAGIINAYKVDAIEREEERLHALADGSTPDKRREILEELVRLNRMRDRLKKRVRWELPQWELKGE